MRKPWVVTALVAVAAVLVGLVAPAGPAGAGGASAPVVALLFDDDYVDIDTENLNAELALEDAGADVRRIEDITLADWQAALDGADVLVLGELEGDDALANDMAADAIAFVSSWVEAGGRVVVFGSDPPWGSVNGIFDTAFTYNGDYDPLCGEANLDPPTCVPTAEAADTEFAGGPAELTNLNDTASAPTGGFPSGTIVIYEDTENGRPGVFVSPLGNGGLVFLGFDWFEDEEPELQALWNEVLADSLAVDASVDDASAAEGSPVQFTISLDGPASQDVVVDYATADGTALAGTDYAAAAGTVVIPAGSTSVTVDVATLARDGAQGARSFSLDIDTPYWGLTADAEGVGTINDVAPVTTTTAAPAARVTPRFTG